MLVRKENLNNPPDKCHKCKKVFDKDEKFYCFGKGDNIEDFFCIDCVNKASPIGQRIRPMTSYPGGQ